jgi:hypothetical protein
VVFVSRQPGHSNPTVTLGTYAHLFRTRRPRTRRQSSGGPPEGPVGPVGPVVGPVVPARWLRLGFFAFWRRAEPALWKRRW